MSNKILCTDGFAAEGLGELKKSRTFDVYEEPSLSHDELVAKIAAIDGIIIRSATNVSRDVIEAGKNLKIIARAGAGTDNIDIDAATEAGIFVVNAPGGNTTSAAELTFAMILALARHIPQASWSMTKGLWEKKKFRGTQIAGKTLGIIGLGRIGREVARRARAFGMSVIAYDPNIPDEQFGALGASQKDLKEIYKIADFISIHTPLTKETAGLISSKEIKMMKRSACIINCARGGIVDEDALAHALREGTIAGAALDVYTQEPFENPMFRGLDNCIMTPHVGAATKEAQAAVAIETARAISQFFSEGISPAAVNLPNAASAEELKGQIDLAEKLGSLVAQLLGKRAKRIKLMGEGALPNLLPIAGIKGVLSQQIGERVTLINAAIMAKKNGIAVSEEIVEGRQDFAGSFGIELKSDAGKNEAWGAVLPDGAAKIVMVDGYRVEIAPSGPILMIRNSDRPGVIGNISSLLGNAGINIAEMQNVRRHKGADAMTIIRIDDEIPGDVLDRISGVDGVTQAAVVIL